MLVCPVSGKTIGSAGGRRGETHLQRPISTFKHGPAFVPILQCSSTRNLDLKQQIWCLLEVSPPPTGTAFVRLFCPACLSQIKHLKETLFHPQSSKRRAFSIIQFLLRIYKLDLKRQPRGTWTPLTFPNWANPTPNPGPTEQLNDQLTEQIPPTWQRDSIECKI